MVSVPGSPGWGQVSNVQNPVCCCGAPRPSGGARGHPKYTYLPGKDRIRTKGHSDKQKKKEKKKASVFIGCLKLFIGGSLSTLSFAAALIW